MKYSDLFGMGVALIITDVIKSLGWLSLNNPLFTIGFLFVFTSIFNPWLEGKFKQ